MQKNHLGLIMEKIRKTLLISFILVSSAIFYGQGLHHQMLSAQGKSVQLSNGMFVSQTIGQQSVIGSYTNAAKIYGQGFQQNVWNKHIQSTSKKAITTITYPNPFINTINFQFSQPIKSQIHIELFDIRGRLVLQTDEIQQTIFSC